MISLGSATIMADELPLSADSWSMSIRPRFWLQRSRDAVTHHHLALVGLATLQRRMDNTQLYGQFRWHSDNIGLNKATRTELHVDQAYIDYAMTTNIFMTLGRRQIFNGVALGHNPTDFLNATKAKNYLLSDEERRTECPGDDVIAMMSLFRDHALQMLFSPAPAHQQRHRWLIQFSRQIQAINTAVEFMGYYADRPGIGLTFSSAVHDNTLAYAELAIRRGRDRLKPVFVNSSWALLQDNANTVAMTWGVQYTFANGIDLNIEYWKDNNGYSDKEYALIQRNIVAVAPPSATMATILNKRPLRPEKLFVRLANIKLSPQSALELIAINSLIDRSVFFQSAWELAINPKATLRLAAKLSHGAAFSEYGSSRDASQWLIGYRYDF